MAATDQAPGPPLPLVEHGERRSRLAALRRYAGWLRVAVAVALVVALFWTGAIDAAGIAASLSSPLKVLACLLCLLAAIHVAILRWSILLRLQGASIPCGRLWNATFIGLFAGTFLPGGIAQDAVRTLYAARTPGCGAGRAITSVVADRILGVAGLLVATCALLLANREVIAASPPLRTVAWVAIAAAGLTAVAVAAYLLIASRPGVQDRAARFVDGGGRFRQAARPVVTASRAYRQSPLGLAACLGLSVLVHLFTALALISLAPDAMQRLDAAELALASLLSNLANYLPLTPDGIGVGEGVFDQICRWFAGPGDHYAYASVFLSARAIGVAVALVGALSYATYRRQSAPRTA